MEIFVSSKAENSSICDCRTNILKHAGVPTLEYDQYSWNGDKMTNEKEMCSAIKTKIFEMSRDNFMLPKHETSSHRPYVIKIADKYLLYLNIDNSYFSEHTGSPLFSRIFNILDLIEKISENYGENFLIVLSTTNRTSKYYIEGELIFKISWSSFREFFYERGYRLVDSNTNGNGVTLLTKNKKISVKVGLINENDVPMLAMLIDGVRIMFWSISESVSSRPDKYNVYISKIVYSSMSYDYSIGDLMNLGINDLILDVKLKKTGMEKSFDKYTINHIDSLKFTKWIYSDVFRGNFTISDVKNIFPNISRYSINPSFVKQKPYSIKMAISSPTHDSNKNKNTEEFVPRYSPSLSRRDRRRFIKKNNSGTY